MDLNSMSTWNAYIMVSGHVPSTLPVLGTERDAQKMFAE